MVLKSVLALLKMKGLLRKLALNANSYSKTQGITGSQSFTKISTKQTITKTASAGTEYPRELLLIYSHMLVGNVRRLLSGIRVRNS